MGLQRENLAVDAEAADAVVRTETQGGKQGVGIAYAQVSQLDQSIGPRQSCGGGRRRGTELDRLISKNAAESESE
jgi:hypothetical protein